MPIYTKRGDEGMTDLWNMERVAKTATRVEAYGTVDEVNTVVGAARPTGYDDVDEMLERVQNDLFVVQADFANPDSSPGEDDLDGVTVCIEPDRIERLEGWIDDLEADLDPLDSFVLPGGSGVGATLHQARAVCRRAERRAVALDQEEDTNEHALGYLNRLSDLLFVLARTVNNRKGVAEDSPTY